MEGYSPLATGREIPASEKCPKNVPGCHSWAYSTHTVYCRDCRITFDGKNNREIVAAKLQTIQVDADKYVLVPKEATPEMIHAATLKFMRENGGLEASISEVWTAMVGASPCLYPQAR